MQTQLPKYLRLDLEPYSLIFNRIISLQSKIYSQSESTISLRVSIAAIAI